MRRLPRHVPGCIAALLIALCAAPARADAPVTVVVDANAPAMEQFAAGEGCGYLDKLFGVEVSVTHSADSTSKPLIVVGSAAIKVEITKKGMAELSDQGVAFQSLAANGRPTLIVGGGSPRATLWAAYDLAERWGVRFLLHGDVLPA